MVPVTTQSAGVRISGGATANHPNKSMRLYGRNSYSGDIYFPLFPDLYDGAGDRIDSFAAVTLRNAGNDNGYCYIRDALAHTLAREIGLPVSAYRPVAVYLNGKYHGILNAREYMNADYFARHYNISASRIAILTDDVEAPRLEDGGETDLGDYIRLMRWVADADFRHNSTVDRLDVYLDVANLTDYYAVEILCGNIDWPHNNILIWRGYDDTAPYGDRRWRFALKDFDVAFGQMSPDSWYDVLGHAIKSSTLFGKLLTNERWQAQFVARVEELLASAFHPDYIIAVANEMRLGIAAEMPHHLNRWLRSVETQDNRYGELYDFVMKQPAYMARVFALNLGVDLALPDGPPPPPEPKDGYPFPDYSIIYNGLLSEFSAMDVDGVLCVPDGAWIPAAEFAERHGLLAFVHEPTRSVVFSPVYAYAPR
jgi:hypothetical protein